ncbi:MAG: hypothetical protein L7F78_01505 [Syntrophales bacterium LBB04]|nr:hypothetical protein [Syntrophales bacterium LBB04]
MKTKSLVYALFFCVIACLVLSPSQSAAAGAASLPDTYFDAPVMPGGVVVKAEEGRMEVAYDLTYEKVLAWYKESLKDYKDGKYRDWDTQMYIEDQGGAKWHSIGISKGGGARTTVTTVKDNWTWIFSTLLVRFAGVFVVLISLMVLLMISSAIMRKFIEKGKTNSAAP